MAIDNEVKELLQKVMDNPDMIDKMNLFLRTTGGIQIRYKFDRQHIEKQKQKEELKKLKEQDKTKPK